MHQVANAERHVQPADDVGVAFDKRGMWGILFIEWQVHEEAGLDLPARFLHQHDFARSRHFAVVAGRLHGCPARGFRQHVVAQGAQVAVTERFQIDDGAIRLAFAFGPDAEAGINLPADGRSQTRLVGGGNELDVADTLDPWV